MMSDGRARLKSWLESGAATLHPLTYPQRELWEAAALDVADPANSICCEMQIRGLITEDAARSALQRVVDRHEVMRLSILPGKKGPLQLVRKSCELNFEFEDLRDRDVETVSREFFSRRFNLVVGPLYRILVLRFAVDRHVVLFAMHHAIGDGWSWGVFAQDLVTAYVQTLIGGDRPLPVLTQTYMAWGAANNAYWTEALLQERLTFWRPHISGLPRLWTVPIVGQNFERRGIRVPAELTFSIRRLALRTGATLYSTLLAAFQIAFGKWAGTDDVVVGTPVANRRSQLTSDIVGSFAAMLPIRNQIDAAMTFAEHLRRTHQTAAECFANPMPFTELAKNSGMPAKNGLNPLYETRFALQNQPVPRLSAPGLDANLIVRWTGSPRFQIACEVTEDNEALEVIWTTNGQLFKPSDVERLSDLLIGCLHAACHSPDERVRAIASP